MRHLKRHELRTQRIQNNDLKNIRKLGDERKYKKNYDQFFMVGDKIDNLKNHNIQVSQLAESTDLLPEEQVKTINSSYQPVQDSLGRPTTASTPLPPSSAAPSTAAPATPSNNLLDWIFNNDNNSTNIPNEPSSSTAPPPYPPSIPPTPLSLNVEVYYNSADNFNIESLFLTGESNEHGTNELEISPNSLLLNMFNDPTLFPTNGMNSYTQYKSRLIKIDDLIYTNMINLIPLLSKNPDFTIPNIEDLLENYWRFFHPALPFLHKPSFTMLETPILLLLSMILIGTRYVKCLYFNKKKNEMETKASKFQNPMDLGYMIAEPLRWLIFSSREFAPPSRLWVFQSLVMLEFFEKSCSSRVLHERAHLHHGTIIQLLRRSPSLGGNPIKLDNKNTAEITNHDIWKRWVDIESMKRITFAVFYLDVIDAIRYGHQVMVFAHQIQLPLPCDDDLWENMKVNNDENGTVVPKQPLFLDSLKLMLNDTKIETTNFGKEILFAGLLSVMFQLQQREMQISYGLEKFDQQQLPNRNWKDLISLLLTIWKCDIAGDCCNTLVSHSHSILNDQSSVFLDKFQQFQQLQSALQTPSQQQAQNSPNSTLSVYSSDEFDDSSNVVPQYLSMDTTCKHTLYHILHLYMRIPHYDFIILAGAPFWMNVRPSNNDRILIRNRVEFFFKSKDSRFCLIQCYLLLWETFLKPQDDPKDPMGKLIYSSVGDVFNRSTMIGMCLIYIWDYNFIREGIEDTTLKIYPNKDLEDVVEKEDGYHYLLRIRTDLCKLCGNKPLHLHYTPQKGVENHKLILEYAKNVEYIPNKQLLVGLLKLVSSIFQYSENELTREHGRLLRHCARRSCGHSLEICEDMYRVNHRNKQVTKVDS